MQTHRKENCSINTPHSIRKHFTVEIYCNPNNPPSASTSFIISCNSASVGFCPRDLITVPNSFVVIVPSPSLSNKLKASLNSIEIYIAI